MKSKSTPLLTEPFPPSSKPWIPHGYQRASVKYLLEHAAGALFLDPGLGKTACTFGALKVLFKKGLASKVLVLAPRIACYDVWPVELQKWTDFHGFKMVVLHGKDKDERLHEDADIFVINPEGLEWLLQYTKSKTPKGKTKIDLDIRRWKNLGFDTLVFDELSLYKYTNTNRFKALKLILHTFARRWGLTGSPAANGLMDLFGQCFMLDQGRTLGPYVSHYQREYFVKGYDGFSWVLKEGSEQKIYKRLRPLALRVSDDVLDMPKLIENHIKVMLPEDVYRTYLQVENDMFSRLDKNTVTAANAAVASGKCSQIANGGVFVDQEVIALVKLPISQREWVNLHDAKTEALAGLIRELQGQPLLVAYDYEHDLDRLQKLLGDKVPYIGGGVSHKRVSQLVSQWNSGKLDVLLGHPQSMARSVNLQECGKHIAWHSMTWNYELYDQYIRRIRRQGNKSRRVFCHHIIAAGTVDEVKLDALRAKARGQQALFKALKAYRARKRQ